LPGSYNLTPTRDGFSFITDAGATYFLYFSTYYLTGINGEDIEALHFGFNYESYKLTNRKYDAKIKRTIVGVINDCFEQYPKMRILYFCRNDDGYGRNRKITFNRWYKAHATTIEKFDSRAEYSKEGLYASILIRSDHPQKNYYVDAFYRSIDMFFPEAA